MPSVQSPLVGLEMTPETATYVGILERQVAAYAVQEAKFRALLELLTGDSWETTKLDIDGKAIMAVAVDALVKRTGLSMAQAQALVTKRWNTVNQVTTAPTPSSTTIEQIVSEANASNPNAVVSRPGAGLSMAQRLASWQERQKQNASTVSGVSEANVDVTQSNTTGGDGSTT